MKNVGIVIGIFLLFGVGILVGVAIKGSTKVEHTASEQLTASQIGNVQHGRQLFVTDQCAACHSYRGKGGTDGPPLDMMRGHMTARDIATMSGDVWNHVPQMQKFFAEEHIKYPTFSENDMADLIAYLHGGGQSPDMNMMKSSGGAMMGGDHMSGSTR